MALMVPVLAAEKTKPLMAESVWEQTAGALVQAEVQEQTAETLVQADGTPQKTGVSEVWAEVFGLSVDSEMHGDTETVENPETLPGEWAVLPETLVMWSAEETVTVPEDGLGDIRAVLDSVFGNGLPERWYAGAYGRKPEVRSQGKYGTCWALTAVSALEASLLSRQHIVFSADHMALNNSFTVPLNEGGDYLMTMAYLSGWQGPVTEEEDPYGDEYSPDGLSPAVHVQEMQILEDADERTIKTAVYEYGAVQTSLYMNRSTTAQGSTYYNEETAAYYYPDEMVQNHDILVLGWDDSFSRYRFSQVPDRDGAFICQNTWGSDFGEDGIFYVSYADANFGTSAIVYTRIEGTDNYDRLYQTDDCGWQGHQGYDDDTCWFANVYTAESKEQLAAVGFYVTGQAASYDIYVVHNFDDAESFGQMEYLQSGSRQRVGYYTVDLEEQVTLEEGERFAVIVKLTAPGQKNPVAVEYRADSYTQNVTTEGKEGYLSQTGEQWQNTEVLFGTNVCLKAYTRYGGAAR